MVKTLAREPKAGKDIFKLKVGQLLQNLLGRKTISKQIKHIGYSNSHVANARSAVALVWIYSDSLGQVGHTHRLLYAIIAWRAGGPGS